MWQSARTARYQAALDQLVAHGLAYPCACTRKDIEAALAAQGQPRERHGELVYPGTCRSGLGGRAARAWRLRVPEGVLHWTDRRLGAQQQEVARAVGDVVLRRADGLFAYQLAVVVDDADQGITHVVRGEDLADNTPRQLLLQRALGVTEPVYLHTPLVLAADGCKLSKQNGAAPLDLEDPLSTLAAAAAVLELPAPGAGTVDAALAAWVPAWCARWGGTGPASGTIGA